MSRNYIYTGLVIILLVGLYFWGQKSKEQQTVNLQEMTSREVALMCTTDMATQYHIHPELSIVIDGVPVEIPNDIGIMPTCMRSIHTHDSTGIIHVEAEVQKDFTLSDFFAVWDKPFSKEQILDSVVDPTHEIVMTVNGQVVDTYENTILRDKDKIVITYEAKE